MNRKEKISNYYNLAHNKAIELIIVCAKDIMKRNPEILEYCQAMGTWNFTELSGDFIDNDDKRVKSISDIMDEWDEYLKLTGYPMRFTAKSEILTNW
jgi:hypothetical protein